MKKPILIYDICSIPDQPDMTMEFLMHIYNKHNVIFYDGNLGNEPQIIDAMDIEVEFLDVSKQENLKKLTGYKQRIK